jgi:hypothetical protein
LRLKAASAAIIFLVSGGDITVICSNNNLKLKDTEWFLINRQMPDGWVKNKDDEE